jgi:hypothetical protein
VFASARDQIHVYEHLRLAAFDLSSVVDWFGIVRHDGDHYHSTSHYGAVSILGRTYLGVSMVSACMKCIESWRHIHRRVGASTARNPPEAEGMEWNSDNSLKFKAESCTGYHSLTSSGIFASLKFAAIDSNIST